MVADNAAKPMHSDFPRWYREVTASPDSERCEARWSGLSALISDADRELVETLLKLVIRTKVRPSPTTLQRVRAAFREADDLFEMSGNDRELEILSGAALAVLMNQDDEKGAKAALAASTASLGGLRTFQLPMDLPRLAEAALPRIAEARRRRPSLEGFTNGWNFEGTFSDAKAMIAAMPAGTVGDDPQKTLEAILVAAKSAVDSIAITHTRAMGAVEETARIQDEELDMLWWATNGWSKDLGQNFDAVPSDFQPLLLGRELATMVAILPGPVAAQALLARAGLKGRKKLTITSAVAAADPGWVDVVLQDVTPSEVTTPLHFALLRARETRPAPSWSANWAAVTGLNPEHAFALPTLAELFLREHVLLTFE